MGTKTDRVKGLARHLVGSNPKGHPKTPEAPKNKQEAPASAPTSQNKPTTIPPSIERPTVQEPTAEAVAQPTLLEQPQPAITSEEITDKDLVADASKKHQDNTDGAGKAVDLGSGQTDAPLPNAAEDMEGPGEKSEPEPDPDSPSSEEFEKASFRDLWNEAWNLPS